MEINIPVKPQGAIPIPNCYKEHLLKGNHIEHLIDDIYVYRTGSFMGNYVYFDDFKTK